MGARAECGVKGLFHLLHKHTLWPLAQAADSFSFQSISTQESAKANKGFTVSESESA